MKCVVSIAVVSEATLMVLGLVLPAFVSAQDKQVPVFTVTPEESNVKFFVKASVAIDGKFKK